MNAYELPLVIATGRSCRDMNWKSQRLTWGDLVRQLRTPRRTHETLAEYARMTKDARGRVKDVGGYVGGPVEGGRRNKGSVRQRYLVTLDIDAATPETWPTFCAAYRCAAFLYPTHSWTPEAPRYRLVVPLSRAVDVEEYQAIARRLAESVNIETIDPTTYEPERLMYWPSVSADAPYEPQEQQGEALDADAVLATFVNWHDLSQLPTAAQEAELVQRSIGRQGRPAEKPGIVGLFCRTYDVPAAIRQFLTDRYKEGPAPGRYTWAFGSSSNGLVLYEGGAFAYAHDATDPCSHRLCNAFDLVRIHLFGAQDEQTDETCPINRRPSYLAMQQWAEKDAAVIRRRMGEDYARAPQDFADVSPDKDFPATPTPPTGDVALPDWVEQLLPLLDCGKGGIVKSTMPNAQQIIAHAPGLKGVAYNAFASRIEVRSALPWSHKEEAFPRPWNNFDDSNLQLFLSRKPWEIKGKDGILAAFDTVAYRRQFHPVREFLRGLPHWDGVARLDALLIDYLGANDTELVRAMTRKTLVAAVARIFKPGTKFDYILTLMGQQGIGKSTLPRRLCYRDEWYNDTPINVEEKDGMEAIQGKWISEIAELSGYKKSDVETFKAFASKTVDHFRPAYGRRAVDCPRQGIFIATTNEFNIFKGDTGNRRFWPLQCYDQTPTRDVFRIPDDILFQLWAEAKYYYEQGEPLYLSADLEAEARRLQQAHNASAADERLGIIEAFLRKPIPSDWNTYTIAERYQYIQTGNPLYNAGPTQHYVTRKTITTIEVNCELFGYSPGNIPMRQAKEVANLLKMIPGVEQQKGQATMGIYGRQIWYKLNLPEEAE
jgi:predicted P-loop ATPase